MKRSTGSTIFIVIFVILIFVSIFYGIKQGFFQNRARNLGVKIGSKYNPKHYTPLELKHLLEKNAEKYVVIDARTKKEYEKGHIPGAVHADYYDRGGLIKTADDRLPVTYDAFSSMRGIYAAYVLYQAGYRDVGILLGGLGAWAEDIGKLDASQPGGASVFMHPRNIFPERKKEEYPKNAGSVTVNIVARKFYFSPDQIRVKHGQKVTLHITSQDVIHGFSLPEFMIEEELLPNQQVDIEFIADRKGNFPFVTNIVSGKNYSSMVGNLIVE